MPRRYRLGRRQAAVDRTTAAIVSAARDLVSSGGRTSMAAIAERAGVSRATLYHRFPSRSRVLAALAPPPPAPPDSGSGSAVDALREAFQRSASAWAADPALYRALRPEDGGETARHLAARLAASDALRPGCSLREAEDVMAALMSFAVFDRLHRDGRRAPAAVAEILARLAGGILA